MKYRNAIFAWTPSTGDVRIGTFPDREGWSKKYQRTVGGVFLKTRGLRGYKANLQVFLDFHHAVVRDGIDPRVAHAAFLAIDEYRDCLAEDCVNLGKPS